MKAVPNTNIILPSADGNKPAFYEPGNGKAFIIEPWYDDQSFALNSALMIAKDVFLTLSSTHTDSFKVIDLEGRLSDTFTDHSSGGLFETIYIQKKGLSGDKKILAGMSSTNNKLFIFNLENHRITNIIDLGAQSSETYIALNTDGSKVWVKIGINDIIELDVATETTSTIPHSSNVSGMVYNPTTNALIIANRTNGVLEVLDISSSVFTDIAGTSYDTSVYVYNLYLSDSGKYIVGGSSLATDPIAVLLTSNDTAITGIDTALIGMVKPGPLNTFTTLNNGTMMVSKILDDTTVKILYSGMITGIGDINYLFGMGNLGDLSVSVPFTVSADDSIFKVITRDHYTGEVLSYMFASEADTVGGELVIRLHSQYPVDVEISGLYVTDHEPNKAYVVGDIVSTTDSSYKWRCITAGTSEAVEPVRFDVDIDVEDGTCLWTKDNALTKPNHYTRLIPNF